MKLWELIKKGAEEGVEVLKESAYFVGRKSRILKRRVELTSVQGDVRKVFTRLGSLAYEFHSKTDEDFYLDEGVKGLIARIESHKIRVREIEGEIEAIKGEERRKTSGKTWESHEQHPPI